MGKKVRGIRVGQGPCTNKVRDGTGPYSGGTGRRKRAGAICPFDKDNKEKIKTMDIELNTKRKVKVVSDKIGEGSFI